jgi:hypothetical protein
MRKCDYGCRKHHSVLAALLVVAVAFLLGACSSGLTVRSDQDPSADFSQFRTFNFFDPMGIEGGYNSPIFGELFREAITNEMTERGYSLSNSPGLIINVTIQSDEKISMRSYSAPYMSGGYYRRPGGYYGSGVGVGAGVGTRATKTTEASVFIDLVDPQTQRVVWQGVAVVDVNDKVAQRLRDSIFTAVNVVYDQYTHTAGR